MTLTKEYIYLSELFEEAVSRSSQLAALASVLQDAMSNPDSSPKAIHDAAWLLSDLLFEQREALTKLYCGYRETNSPQHEK